MSLIISDEVVKASGMSEEELFLEVILLLFQQEKISLGRAAELLKMSQIHFQRLISERGLCIHYDVPELREDIEHLTAKGWL